MKTTNNQNLLNQLTNENVKAEILEYANLFNSYPELRTLELNEFTLVLNK